jgi:hypothetical protein
VNSFPVSKEETSMPSWVGDRAHSTLDQVTLATLEHVTVYWALLLPLALAVLKIVFEWGAIGVQHFPAALAFSVLSFDLYAVMCSTRNIPLTGNLTTAPEQQKPFSIIMLIVHVAVYGVAVKAAPGLFVGLLAGTLATAAVAVLAYVPGWLLMRVERRGLLT